MSRVLLKLYLILWKNFIIRKRHWVLTIFEIVLPILLCIINICFTSFVPKQYITDTRYFDKLDFDVRSKEHVYLYYAPNNVTWINDLMQNVDSIVTSHRDFEDFENEYEMIQYIQKRVENDTRFSLYKWEIVAVVFDDIPEDGSWPKKLNYRLRTFMSDNYGLLYPNSPYEDDTSNLNEYVYGQAQFANIQHAIDTSYINITANSLNRKMTDYKITLQKIPYPPHENNLYITVMRAILPVFTSLGFILLFLSVLKRILEEKSTGIKELMKMMGLESWMSWVGWFVYSMMLNTISVTIITVLYKVGLSEKYPGIFINSNIFLVWAFLMAYCITTLCFLFAISNLFKSPRLGTSTGFCIWIVLGLIGDQFIGDDPTTSVFFRYLFLLLVPNVSLKMGYNAILEFERKGGLNFANFFAMPNKYAPHPPMGCVMSVYLFQCLLFLLLTWYIENVYPGEFGVAKPWYFPFTTNYWFSNRISDSEVSLGSMDDKDEIEKNTNNIQSSIQIRDLHKYFGKKHVVKGFSLDIYQKQITVLLGHNGAGKTTTMNIITGITSPSKGAIVANGYDIFKHMDSIRKTLGLCPQFDVQFTDLTVFEHLIFFAMLRGASAKNAKTQALEVLQRLDLIGKNNKLAGELSGGMRRKLSLAMAIVGNSSILILDEPTSGLDPEARREIWDFLLSMRGTKTILITTHYMEEADILGDRIAIMHNGELKCYGTSLFLKKHYGTGYVLNVLTGNEYDLETISNSITPYVSEAKVKNINGNCITYMLPSNDTSALSQLFMNLEKKKKDLNITTFGVSITTMEEVFLRVGEIADEVDRGLTNGEDESKRLLDKSFSENVEWVKVNTPLILLMQQLKGLIIKRFKYSKRKWFMHMIIIGIPLLIILFALTMMKIDRNHGIPNDVINVNLVLGKYKEANVLYSYDEKLKEYADIYKDLITKQNITSTNVTSVDQTVLEIGKNIIQYDRTLVVAAEFNSTPNLIELNGMYGSFAYHGPAISLNLLTNTLLRKLTNDSSYSINITNNPIRTELLSGVPANSLEGVIIAINWMFLIPVAFVILIGGLIIFPQEERKTSVLHLQIMAGVPKIIYWFSNFLYDLVIFISVTIILVILMLSFDYGGSFGNPKAIWTLILLILCFGFAVLPFAYILTYRNSAGGNMSLLITIQLLIGGVAGLIMIGLNFYKSYDPSGEQSGFYKNFFNTILYFFPHFAFSYGIFIFTKHSVEIRTWEISDAKERILVCTKMGNPCCLGEDTDLCQDYLSYFGDDSTISIKNQVDILLLHFVIYSIILLFLESGIPGKYWGKLFDWFYRKNNDYKEILNEDVQEEKERIDLQISNQQVTDILIAKNLKKWYSRGVYAARDVNFGVKAGECFGLLGVNGAGKTTTFKMLTGDIPASDGVSYIHGISINKDKETYMKNIGYCPQIHALNMTLTGREMLTLFAYIRGVPEYLIPKEVNNWLVKCGIKEYENIICQKYSGGNKRKLSFAVALIGNPSIIMLDEPTCGVDPVARRKLWNVLSVIRKAGQSIVLTTHSMEECEALCERLAIMVNGQLKCIGNIQTLKSKFGQGFTVIVKLSQMENVLPTEIINLKENIQRKFDCQIKDEHIGMIHYHINSANTSIGEIFSFMEQTKESFRFIEDYTVNDTTLEEVFLSFAKMRNDPVRISNASTASIV